MADAGTHRPQPERPRLPPRCVRAARVGRGASHHRRAFLVGRRRAARVLPGHRGRGSRRQLAWRGPVPLTLRPMALDWLLAGPRPNTIVRGVRECGATYGRAVEE